MRCWEQVKYCSRKCAGQRRSGKENDSYQPADETKKDSGKASR